MARPRKPARLYQRPDTGEWVIRDAGRDVRTGHRGDSGRCAAEEAFSKYLAEKLTNRALPKEPQALADVPVSMVLTHYLETMREEMAAPERQAYAIKAMSDFWTDKTVAQIDEETCRAYMKSRPSASTARRELGVLRAALGKAHRSRILAACPAVWLPSKGKAKPDWLTRDEFAKLLWEL